MNQTYLRQPHRRQPRSSSSQHRKSYFNRGLLVAAGVYALLLGVGSVWLIQYKNYRPQVQVQALQAQINELVKDNNNLLQENQQLKTKLTKTERENKGKSLWIPFLFIIAFIQTAVILILIFKPKTHPRTVSNLEEESFSDDDFTENQPYLEREHTLVNSYSPTPYPTEKKVDKQVSQPLEEGFREKENRTNANLGYSHVDETAKTKTVATATQNKTAPPSIVIDSEESLVTCYNNHSQLLSKDIIVVTATKESYKQQRAGYDSPVILEEMPNGNYWITMVPKLESPYYYLVPKNNLVINNHNCQIVQEIFDCCNFDNRSSHKFKLKSPAVVKYNSSGNWEIYNYGELSFS